jgi:hypothetical protein
VQLRYVRNAPRHSEVYVKKLVVLGAGAIAVAGAALLTPAVADSDPGSAAALNVVGEPYGKALAILKGQGVKAFFGGAVGGDVPQAQCIVNQQKVTSGGRMYLSLDCSQKAVLDATASMPAGGGGGPNVGSNGITTVTPTPVGPQPGMSVPGA